jgi:serine/threonine protein phosphatase PrpC
MSLGQVATVSDTGRKRRHNEDSFVCEPPLFAIADGMGGAQAGEVASGVAAGALEERAGEGGESEDRVISLIQDANRRVYAKAREDAGLSGMGTTLTLALVGDGHVALGHVGDSRAYLFRDGRLEQITEDHSLVAELTRAGKLSEEEAEIHPQRSVITRALGTEPDVDVDSFTVKTKDGDVFMLCSDGLTSMVEDDAILEILRERRKDLERAARDLVRAANRGGGEDNITVLLFEIVQKSQATVESKAPPELDEAEEEDEEEEDTLSGLDPVPVVDTREDEWTEDGYAGEAAAKRPVERRERRHRIYWVAAAVLVLVVIGLTVFGLSQSHFVGARSDGHVAVYQGVPYSIAGIHLYRTVYVSPLLAAQLTQTERQRLFDHDLRGYDSAKTAIRRLEQTVEPWSFQQAQPEGANARPGRPEVSSP